MQLGGSGSDNVGNGAQLDLDGGHAGGLLDLGEGGLGLADIGCVDAAGVDLDLGVQVGQNTADGNLAGASLEAIVNTSLRGGRGGEHAHGKDGKRGGGGGEELHFGRCVEEDKECLEGGLKERGLVSERLDRAMMGSSWPLAPQTL